VSSFDAGEGGVSNGTVLVVLAEYVGPSAPMALARKYNGVAVLWEHRFYGESLPFEVDDATGFAKAGQSAYMYLNNEQALEDTVYFAQNFHPAGLQQSWRALSPSQTPWVFIGGSYPGMSSVHTGRRSCRLSVARNLKPWSSPCCYWLASIPGNAGSSERKPCAKLTYKLCAGVRAAVVRERNPETWFASWASSAPVEAQVDMSVYFNPMEQVGQRSPW
jgi:hypothetical protein